jgi:hypothetical protein
VPTHLKRATRRFGREMRRFVVALLVLVVVVGIARAGAAYIYCSGMDEVVAEACCELHVHGRADGEPQVAALSDCCSAQRMGAIPEGAAVARAELAPRTLTRVQPVPSPAEVRRLAPLRMVMRGDAPDTGPPKPSDIASRLCVFLI